MNSDLTSSREQWGVGGSIWKKLLKLSAYYGLIYKLIEIRMKLYDQYYSIVPNAKIKKVSVITFQYNSTNIPKASVLAHKLLILAEMCVKYF